MKNIAVYAGTFDPVTFGHVDLLERGVKLFDKVIVAIAASPKKVPLFSLEERVSMAREVLVGFDGIEVKGFDGLLLDFARENQAKIILRGLRTVTDFDYEFQLASMNRRMDASIESLFLMPSEKHMYVASSLVREIASMRGDITAFVPSVVADKLIAKFNK